MNDKAHLSVASARPAGGAATADVSAGSVKKVPEKIEHKTYQHLGCKNDGQALGDY